MWIKKKKTEAEQKLGIKELEDNWAKIGIVKNVDIMSPYHIWIQNVNVIVMKKSNLVLRYDRYVKELEQIEKKRIRKIKQLLAAKKRIMNEWYIILVFHVWVLSCRWDYYWLLFLPMAQQAQEDRHRSVGLQGQVSKIVLLWSIRGI